jgi:cytochrome P450
MSDEELLSNLLVLEYGQAHLHAAFWVLYALALHPEDERRVVNEIAEVLSQGPLTYERMNNMKYLTKCVSESLRLFPGN